MDAVNKESTASDASVTETSILEISTNNPDDTLSYQTADEENSSKYFSMIADSTVEGSSSADVTLEGKSIINDSLSEKVKFLNKLSNVQSKCVDKLQIHEKIDAAKILSGGVDIFDDNENSSDEHGLVIDYDAQTTETVDGNAPVENELKKESNQQCANESKELDESKDDTLKSNDEEQLIKSGEEEQLLKSAEEELAIAGELQESKEVVGELEVEKTDNYSALLQSNLPEGSSEVTLLIDDKNVDAIDIGEGVFIYKNDEGELTAIQITMNEDGTTNFKCLHVGKNEDGNLEVYEEQVSQVPVTTEELESMRSQELAEPSNISPAAATAENNTLRESKGASNIPKGELIKDVVLSKDAGVPHDSSQGDQTNTATVAKPEDVKLTEIPKIECSKEGDASTNIINDSTLLENKYDISSPASVSPNELINKDKNAEVEVADVKVTVKTTLANSLVEADLKSDKSAINETEESKILPTVEKNNSDNKESILLDDNLETSEKLETMEISNLMNSSDLKTLGAENVNIPNNDISTVEESEKSCVSLSSDDKISKPFLQEDTTTVSSPVNVCGVSTKISDPVLPAEFISDSQDSTSNILSVINNEESSNTVESVVSSCPSINPTDSIMSEQLSINDALCTKLGENNKILTFEMSNLEFKGEITQSASPSEDLSQGESVSKSISDEELSNDSNVQPLIIEDNSTSQDSVSEALDVHKDSVDLSAVSTVKSTTITCDITEKEIPDVEVRSIGECTETQTSVESDDEDYVVGEPVTGDSGVEWNSGIQEKPTVADAKITPDPEISVSVSDGAKVTKEIELVKGSDVNLSDNNNDVTKTPVPEKEISEKSKCANDIIKEVDFDKFVRRNSVQMFEECIHADYEDVRETIKTKSVPVLELEYKSAVIESAANNIHVATHKAPVTTMTIHQTLPVASKSSKSVDEKILSNAADRTPSPKKHLLAYKPNYSPVDSNKYMNKAPYSSFTNQIPKHYLPNKVSPTPQSPTQGVRKEDTTNIKPRTYTPVHRTMPHNASPPVQKAEKTLSFSVLNEKQSPTLPSTPVLPSQRTSPQTSGVTIVTSGSLLKDSKQCSVGTQVENTTEENLDKAKTDGDIAEAQRNKNRQPRKQVFTPVTRSDMEIIFPNLYNNAQEYKKETDSKALKLKKEQDLKFKQLSKKEQSKRAERTRVQNKPLEKIVSPVKSVDKNVHKDTLLLSTPVKSFDKTAVKESIESTISVKGFDKTVVKESIESTILKVNDRPTAKEPPYLSSPHKISDKVHTDSISTKSPNETISKDVHLSSPVKSFSAVNINDPHRVTSPIKIDDKVKDHLNKSSPIKSSDPNIVKESPYVTSPVQSSPCATKPERIRETKQYAIDLPVSNVDKSPTCLNKYTNHHDLDNSRLNVSPRTYSRFLNKLPNQNVESPRYPIKQFESLPKLTKIIENKTSKIPDDVAAKYSVPIKTKEQTGMIKNTEIDLIRKENTKTDITLNTTETNQTAIKENMKRSLYNDSPRNEQDGDKSVMDVDRFVAPKNNKKESLVITNTGEIIKPNTSKEVSKKTSLKGENISKLSEKETPKDAQKSVKKSPGHTQASEKKSSGYVQTCEKISHRDEQISEKNSPKDAKISDNNSTCDLKAILETKTPSKVSNVSESDSPLTESAKRKRGRPKKIVADSPVVTKSKESESPVRKVDNILKVKLKPKESPKLEEKSRASSISPFGKIDENIKCPICFKTFRTHNVLIKHVKHCNGNIDIETLKTPKKRKLTDSLKSEESMDSNKSEEDKEKKKDSDVEAKKISETPVTCQDSSNQSKVKVESLSCAQKNTVNKDNDSKKTIGNDESVIISKEETLETIILEDTILTDSPKVLEKSVKDIGKTKTDDFLNFSKNDTVKKNKAPVGRPAKDKSLEETKQSSSKQTAAPSPMSRLAKILSTKPPASTPIACTVCGKTFRQLAHMVYHRSSKHNVEETDVTAETSNVDVVSKSKPEEAGTPVEADAILKCEICHKGFRKLHHLVEHREVHANSETKSRRTSVASVKSEPEAGFRCDTCDKSFRKLHHLVEHRELHSVEVAGQPEVPTTPTKVNDPKPIEDATCPGCGKSFRKRHHMVEHRDVHCSPSKKGKYDDGSTVVDTNIRLSIASSTSDEGNNCGICGKSYRKLHHMVEHRESHAEVREEKAKNKTAEPEHLNTKDIIHECSRCYMVFPNENSLNKHVDICSKKKLLKKSFNINAQDNGDIVTIVSEPLEKPQAQKTAVPVVEDLINTVDIESRNDDVVIESKQNTPKLVEQQPSKDKSPDVVCDTDMPTAVNSESLTKNLSRKSSDSKDSVKSQKPERKSLATKEPIVPKSQNVRKSTLAKETISSKSRRSLITKYPSSSIDNVSVISRASSLRKSSISSESVSSRTSRKRKSSSSVEYLPLKKSNTKNSSVGKPAIHRKSLDSVSKKITKAPGRRSLQQDAGNNDEDSDVKYKLNESKESDVKYKINPEFSKSIKRLSQSSIDVKPPLKSTIMKAKERRSESALSGLKIPKEKVLQTIIEETNVRYSFPKSPKTESEKPTSSQPTSKKPVAVKQPAASGKKVVITKKTNIVVANKRKSLGGRKSIDTKKLPGLKKLQLRCCSQVFNSQADLAVHRKTHKEVHKVHKCDCGKLFDTEGLLKRHMDIEHTPPKSYKCTQCGASVRTAAQFAKHKRDHEIEQKSQKQPASKKLVESKTTADKKHTKGATNVSKSVSRDVPKTVKVQPGKSKSPVTETRKGVKRKVAHGGVPLSDKMRKAMAGAKF